MNVRSIRLRRTAALMLVGGTILLSAGIGAPLRAHHTIELDAYPCIEATPTPAPELTPPPEGEAPPEEAEPGPPPENCMPEVGDHIRGTRTIRFRATTDGTRPMKRVALYILAEDEGVPDAADGQPLLQEEYARADDVREYDTLFAWDSYETTPYNGRYRIYIEVDTYPAVTGEETHRATATRIHLLVDNPPNLVGAPKVVATTRSSVTIQWLPAPEPDVFAYTIYRATTKSSKLKPSYSAFKPYGVATGNAFRDTHVQPGVFWYAIQVTRRSVVTPSDGISSPVSVMSGPGVVSSPPAKPKPGATPFTRKIAFRDLAPPRVMSRLAAVPDAPFKYKLPYDPDEAATFDAPAGSSSEGGSDPRGGVLPVAVGMFLLSSALVVGRMPY